MSLALWNRLFRSAKKSTKTLLLMEILRRRVSYFLKWRPCQVPEVDYGENSPSSVIVFQYHEEQSFLSAFCVVPVCRWVYLLIYYNFSGSNYCNTYVWDFIKWFIKLGYLLGNFRTTDRNLVYTLYDKFLSEFWWISKAMENHLFCSKNNIYLFMQEEVNSLFSLTFAYQLSIYTYYLLLQKICKFIIFLF